MALQQSLPESTAPTVGLALGGGGVRGLAHIVVLETLDEMGIRPRLVAGTSMGAIVGALYASGMSGAELRELVLRFEVLESDTWRESLGKRAELLRWIAGFSPDFTGRGLFDAEKVIESLFAELGQKTFEGLQVPLSVVATDFWTGEEVVLNSGDLLSAVRASMAVPGIFAPEIRDGRVLIDGGVVNNLPYDHVSGCADVTIAVNVDKTRSLDQTTTPSAWECALGALEIMQLSAVAQKLRHNRPDIYIRPHITGVRILDFQRAADVLKQSEPMKAQLRKELDKRLNRNAPSARSDS